MSGFQINNQHLTSSRALPQRTWFRGKTWARRALLLALSGGGATSFGGCSSVAGPEYTGEVGLELRGEVKALDGEQKEMVPALVFLTADKAYVVDGEVTGEYPKRFALRVDEPPPEDALMRNGESGTFAEGISDQVGVALLTLVAKKHPAVVDFAVSASTITHTTDVSRPDPVTGKFTRTESRCEIDGDTCETLTYACITEACETVLVEEELDSGWADNGVSCQGGPCLTWTYDCDEQSCSRTIAHCEAKGRYDQVASEGSIDRCTLESRTGELPPDVSNWFAQDLVVVFMTEEAEVDGVNLEQGYNVLRVVPRDEKDWAAALTCRLDARRQVMNDPGDATEKEQEARIEQLQARCPEQLKWERLDNPAEHELEISLGLTPPAL